MAEAGQAKSVIGQPRQARETVPHAFTPPLGSLFPPEFSLSSDPREEAGRNCARPLGDHA
jgi:hypothetical protein